MGGAREGEGGGLRTVVVAGRKMRLGRRARMCRARVEGGMRARQRLRPGQGAAGVGHGGLLWWVCVPSPPRCYSLFVEVDVVGGRCFLSGVWGLCSLFCVVVKGPAGGGGGCIGMRGPSSSYSLC